MVRFPPKNDAEHSRKLLDRILCSRRLRFNPYKVSDSQLLEYAWQGRWGEIGDLTQMVIMTFTRIREADDCSKVRGIYMRVGRDQEEVYLPCTWFIYPIHAHDSMQGVRQWYGKALIRNENDMRRLAGKTVFVSRVIRCATINGYAAAYRMYKITGNLSKDAAMIREAMCAAKIEMLERLLAYPESPWHLDCSKGFIDYETPVRELMARIRLYAQTPVPLSL